MADVYDCGLKFECMSIYFWLPFPVNSRHTCVVCDVKTTSLPFRTKCELITVVYKISFIILNILRIMESITFLIHLTTLLGPDFSKKTCFFPSPLNRSWLQPTWVPRILLGKFSYSLFFKFLTINVVKLNMNYPKKNLSITYVFDSVLHIWWTKKGSACSKKKKGKQHTTQTKKE